MSPSLRSPLFCPSGQQRRRSSRHLRPYLRFYVRGCILQTPMVQIRLGPLVLEHPLVSLSSWSVSPDFGYPVDETLDENAVTCANGKNTALSIGLTRRHALRHGADDGASQRWSLVMRILERLDTRLTINVELRYNGQRSRFANAFTDTGGPRHLVVYLVWLRPFVDTTRIGGRG